MGWTFFTVRESEKTREVLTREFSQRAGYDASGEYFPEWTVTDLSIIGRTAYAIIRIDKKTGAEWHGRVILFSRKAYDGQSENFGYKDIAEECFPYYFAAPLSHIEKLDRVAPVDPESNAGKWRAAVRDYHAKQKARPAYAPGQKWVHATGAILELIAPSRPRMGWIVRRLDGVPHSGRASFSVLSKFSFMG